MKKILLIALAILALAACVKDDLYPYPSVANVKNTVAYYETDDVTVTAVVTALKDLTGVDLVYKAGNDAEKTVAMTASGNTYSAVIPAQPMGTEVEYHVEASTADAKTSSPAVSYKVGDVPVDYTKLKLNEINGQEKYIELYNAGDAAITLQAVTIKKNDAKVIWTGSASIIEPKEFLLLYSSDVTATGTAHEGYPEEKVFDGGLSAKKSLLIELFAPDGTLLDNFARHEEGQAWDQKGLEEVMGSWSRIPDGTGHWMIVGETAITPGAANATSGEADPLVK